MINNVPYWDKWEVQKIKPYIEKAIKEIKSGGKAMADLAGGVGRC